MDVLTAFFILTGYEASTPWWVAFSVILAGKFGYWFVNKYEKDMVSLFGFEGLK